MAVSEIAGSLKVAALAFSRSGTMSDRSQFVNRSAQEHLMYIQEKVNPVLEALVTAVLLERPDDPSFFMLRWLCEQTKSLDGAEQGQRTSTAEEALTTCHAVKSTNPLTMELSLQNLVAEVSELLRNSRSMENKKETIFELLRRSCLKSARDESLDTVTDSGIEDVWMFLLSLRKMSPVRQRRIDECFKALSSSERWMRLLQESAQLQELLMDSDAHCQSILRPGDLQVEAAEAAENGEPPSLEMKGPEEPVNPFAKPQPQIAQVEGKAVGNPFQKTKFAQMTPKARAGSLAFSAAFETETAPQPAGAGSAGPTGSTAGLTASNGATSTTGFSAVSAVSAGVVQGASVAFQKTKDFEQKHHLTQRAVEGTRSSVEAVRDANRQYGVTEKIGQGLATAAHKTVEFEREHQVRSRAMQAARASVDAARDANQKYGITQKMGQGAHAAYSKAREIEQKHHVTSTVASGIKNGAANVASAATSLGSKVAAKNPFSAGTHAVPAEAQRNPFRA
eukprot:s679_g9.t1